MVSIKELNERIKEFFSFSKQEITSIIILMLVMGFLFSFRDWGTEQLDLWFGLRNFAVVSIIFLISLLNRFAWQKVYALSEGYKAEFKIWWLGIGISIILTFITFGRVPAILIGGMSVALMVRQRLGEFRYGFSYWNNALISFWGLLGNLVLALLFAIGGYYLPQSYFFSKGMMINLLMGFYALFPLPQLDGLSMYFGSRTIYGISIFLVLLTSVLLLSRTAWGLIIALLLAIFISIGYWLTYSEK